MRKGERPHTYSGPDRASLNLISSIPFLYLRQRIPEDTADHPAAQARARNRAGGGPWSAACAGMRDISDHLAVLLSLQANTDNLLSQKRQPVRLGNVDEGGRNTQEKFAGKTGHQSEWTASYKTLSGSEKSSCPFGFSLDRRTTSGPLIASCNIVPQSRG